MECFRIDESGYTGFDLLNPEQHFQGTTAVAIGDKDAARLIKEHFPKLQASELKYRSASTFPSPAPNQHLVCLSPKCRLALAVAVRPMAATGADSRSIAAHL